MLLLLLLISLGLNAQTDVFPNYEPESYSISLNYRADSIDFFNRHKPNDICNSYMFYNIMGMSPKTKADCDQQIATLQKQIAQRKAYIANVPDAGV